MATDSDFDDDEEDIIFNKAREFLQRFEKTQPSSASIKQSTVGIFKAGNSEAKCTERKIVGFGAMKRKIVKLENTERHKRRKKLKIIKAPLSSFVKPCVKKSDVTADNDENDSVNMMLNHMRKLPDKDIYSPPCIPLVFIQDEESDSCVTQDTTTRLQHLGYIYLSSEKDLATWKTLKKSLTNRNVFAGNLSYKVDQHLLKTVFETLVVKERQHLLKVRVVTDPLSGVSKGYGFIEFPYRRAAELAFICLQGFELYGREMLLGWGEENVRRKPEDCSKDQSNTRTTVSDSQRTQPKDLEKDTCKQRRYTRWDIEEQGEKVTVISDTLSQPGDIFQTVAEKNNVFSIHKMKLGVKGEKNPSASLTQCLPSSKEQSSSRRRHDTTGDLVEANEELSTIHKKSAIEWLTRKQRVSVIKSVCENIRKKNITGHLGVYGEYFETDNTRLRVTFSKNVGEAELVSNFGQYGTLNVNTIESETSAVIQYTTSKSAETAFKKLHGKIVKGTPLSVEIAEPIS